MKLEIEIADTITIESGEAVVVFDLLQVDKEKLADLVGTAAEVGFYKAGVDAAASAKKYREEHGVTDTQAREILIGKRVKTWESGDWGAVRGSGSGLSELDREIVSIMRKPVKESDPKWYRGAAEADRVAKCVEAFGALPEAQQKTVTKTAEARIKRKRKEAEELAALAIEV